MTDESHVNNPEDSNVRLLRLAVERGLLTDGKLQTLLNRSDSTNICDLAIEENIIGSADIDLLKPLAESKTFLPGYEFLEVVGVGATGAVYRARHEKLRRMVALKLLKPSVMQNDSATARSRIEARIGASLQHANVVVVHDYGVHHQRIFLAQEFIQGESVDELIEREGAIRPAMALKLVEQVVRALSHAAESGVVHRDIKPANLLLTEKDAALRSDDVPVVKVSDFGLAFQRLEGENETRLTVDGSTLGTPSYAAPEQLIDSNVDLRADIYSLGATLLHMVSGQQPFAKANAFQAIADKMAGKETWREIEGLELPAAVRQLIMDMTHHAIEDRIQDYQELNNRIQLLLQNEDSLNRLETASNTGAAAIERPLKKQPLVAAVLAAGLAIVAGWLWYSQASQGPIESPYIRTGDEFPLYLGDGLPSPSEHRQRGSFGIEADEDGTDVIEGGPGSTMIFRIPEFDPLSDTFRFQIEVNVFPGSRASICFAMNSEAKDYMFHSVIMNNETATFGSGSFRNGIGPESFRDGNKLGDRAMLTTHPQTPRIELHAATDGPSYQVITIDRQRNGWFAAVNGRFSGSCFSNSDETREIAIHIPQGRVQFANIRTFATEPDPDGG